MGEQIKEMWLKIKENRDKLSSCSKHNFGKFVKSEKGYIAQRKLICENCGGYMELSDIYKYVQGYVANGGNSEDILQGYKFK